MNTKTNSKRKILLLALTLVMVLGTLTACGGASSTTVKVIEIELTQEQYAFGVDKDQPELLEDVNEFIAKIKADGTFAYYEGMLSSHIGIGEWSYSDGTLTLFEKTSRFKDAYEMEEVIYSYSFSVKKDTLIFEDKGSGNFRYVKVKDGEKFRVQ